MATHQMNAVDSLLTRLGLSAYIEKFREQNIVNPKVLKGLDDEQYKKLIADDGDRALFLKAVAGEENVPVSAPQGRNYDSTDDDYSYSRNHHDMEQSRPRKGGKGGKGKGFHNRDGHEDYDDFDRGYKGGKGHKGPKGGKKGGYNRHADLDVEHAAESELVDNGIVERVVTVPTYTFKFLLANKAKKLCEIHRRNGTHNAQIKKEDTDKPETQFVIYGVEEAVQKTKEEIEKLCGIERKHVVDGRFQEALLGRTKMVTSLLYAMNLRRVENGEDTGLAVETIPEHVSRFLFCNPYSHIKQFYINVQEKARSKVEVIGKIIDRLPACQAITFASNVDHIEKILATKIKKEQLSGIIPHFLYPSLKQDAREEALDTFRIGGGPWDKVKYVEEKVAQGEAPKGEDGKRSDPTYKVENTVSGGFATNHNRFMIASDDYARFARKNPIPYVSLVICYDCPQTKEGYLHRIACCGRGGKRGVAISLIGANDKAFLEDLQQFGLEIEELPENFDEAIEISESTELLPPVEKPLDEPPARSRKTKKAEGQAEEEAH